MIVEFNMVCDLTASNPIEANDSAAFTGPTIAVNSSDGLYPFLGECSLINLADNNSDNDISSAQIKEKLLNISRSIEEVIEKYQSRIIQPKRVLIKTKAAQSFKNGRFLSREALQFICQSDILLAGIDMPSLTSEGLEADMQQLGSLSLLANLNLSNLDEGYLYKLLAQPLSNESKQVLPVRPILLG